ncbi:Uncharacterised protein [Corynebacterium ulcerans]|uniref:Uncharacterized protein n=1 Tax=Corynebacterium ulcerans TaxID=65058 RepID=A0ABD7MQG4_CORUL|nr:Uncharacterised protein [Corynebacterium ulcerans]SQG50069.1 Uncharacterised protein [Corynebacterium ulcerans]SQH03676.1 Uncharacterised protein [Corynebacterium ulcerans]
MRSGKTNPYVLSGKEAVYIGRLFAAIEIND